MRLGNSSIRIVIFLILFFSTASFWGCSDGNRSDQIESSTRSGTLSFQLEFANPPSETINHLDPKPIGEPDICDDYAIDRIVAQVYRDKDNNEVASAQSPCSAHSLTIKGVPVEEFLYVVCNGNRGHLTAWRGQVDHVEAKAGQNTDIGMIHMTYIGDDTTSPVVVSTYPTNDATHVDPGASVTVVFSKALAPSTIPEQAIIVLKNDTPVPGHVTYDATTYSISFTPTESATFDPETKYSADLKSQDESVGPITDHAGQPFSDEITWVFTTNTANDTTPPQVIATSPANGADAVDLDTEISAIFSEPMDPVTITQNTLQLSTDSGTVIGQVLYDEQSRTLTMSPDSALDAATLYTAVISTEATDLAHNALSEPYSWHFQTDGPKVTLTIEKSGDGSGLVSSTPSIIDCGDKCQAKIGIGTKIILEANADESSEFSGWSGDFCGEEKGPCSFEITKDTSITSIFKVKTYTIDTSVIPSDGSGGSISPMNANVKHGDDQSFEIKASPDFTLTNLIVDGGTVTPTSPYLFENVTEGHAIQATFKSKYLISEGTAEKLSYPQLNAGHVVWHGPGDSKSDIYDYYYDQDQDKAFVKNLTEKIPGSHFDPQINSKGHMVWYGYTNNKSDIYYYNGSVIKNITKDKNLPGDQKDPQINSSGHVVWHGPNTTIYYYNGSTVRTIYKSSKYAYASPQVGNTDALILFNPSPQLNDEGNVVWTDEYDLYYYDKAINKSDKTPNAPSENFNPKINVKGDVIWGGAGGNDFDIYYYELATKKASIISQNTAGHDMSAQITADGHAVWSGHNDGKTDIYYYNGISIRNMTQDLDGSHRSPQMNDHGYIVWETNKNSSKDIYYYEPVHKTIKNISKSLIGDNAHPQINNNLVVVWRGKSGSSYNIYYRHFPFWNN